MAKRRHPQAPSSRADGEGLRVIPKTPTARGRMLPWAVVVAIVITVALVWWLRMPEPAQGTNAVVAQAGMDRDAAAGPTDGRPSSARVALQAASLQEPYAMPSNDPDDLAAYFQPGDPEPTGAQVIEALQQEIGRAHV